MGKKIQNSFRRYEKKYMITPEQQELIIKGASEYMKSDEYGSYTICNIYYDTDNWSLIRESIEKPMYKEKLRVRSYGVPKDEDRVFVEIKKKFDGIVYKRRVEMEAALTEEYLLRDDLCKPTGQIHDEIQWFQKFHNTKPKVFIGYDRIALAGIEDPELRITFDSNIRWRDADLDLRLGDYGQAILAENEILMEIKIAGSAPIWLSHLLSEVKAFPVSFSKYGTCYKKFIFNKYSAREMNFSA